MTTEMYRDEALLKWLEGDRPEATQAIAPADRTKPLPLSFGQRQLWFLNRLNPDSAEYLVPLVLRLRGPLDTEALRRVWSEIVARHEILRTRYELHGTEPVQVIDEPADVQWTVESVDGEEQALARADELATQPFDLERDHPLRLTLLHLGREDHLLVAVFHHIASDQTSQQVLLGEIGRLYQAFSTGTTASLPEVEVQYADFASWQQGRTEEHARHLGYWREHLAGTTRLELPTDKPRPSVRGWRGAATEILIPADTAQSVRELAMDHSATPFMVLVTAFQTLLARYTGQDDISVGTVVSGRTEPSLHSTLGYLINNLVLRTRVEGSFRELLNNVRTTVLDAFDHQDVPFAKLVDELQPERDMSVTPLFQAAITMHDLPPGRFDVAGLAIEHVELTWQVAKVDLALRVAELPDGSLGAVFEYATDLFEETTVSRMAAHFARLLGRIAANPDTPVREIDFLLDDERELLTKGSGIEVPAPVKSLGEVFEEQVARTPDAKSVIYSGEALSYNELNARANRLAHHLRALGARPNQLVGVCLDRDGDLVPTLVGVTKSGAGYLPLDPAYPADRLQFMIEDAQVQIVVTTSRHVDAVRAIHSGAVVVLDTDTDALQARPAENPAAVSTPDDLAYVIYTSGSTGKPKGVQVTHRNVQRLFTSSHRHLKFDHTDVWSMFHSYAFDVSVWELWGALLHGGQLVVVSFDVSRSPADFLALLADNGVTILSQTPSAFRGLVTLAEAGDPRLDQLTLRAVVFAGEKLELADLAPWIKKFGLNNPTLVNMYGITETTVHSTYYEIVEADLLPGAGNPIGYPLDDLRIHILDQHQQLVPIGVPGEMYVGGPGVTLGYLNRPELTEQRFLPDRWGPDGATMYRSGDLARRLPDGSLQFLGRIDKQVKLRGFRIELGEINSALSEHEDVLEAVVVLREDSPGDKKLVAYLVPVGEEAADPGELRALLGRTLPEYMIPSAFVTLDRIPLTPNGKLDERALPAPDESAMRAKGEIVAPRTPTEEKLAEVYRTVLGVETVGVHDGFFDLGGDSIMAVTLVGSLREHGFEIAVRDVFEYRTIERLAEFVDEHAAPTVEFVGTKPFELISPEDRALVSEGAYDAYPMSQLQIIMLVEMEATDGAENLYHNVSSFEIKDTHPFDFEAFQRAGAMLAARHEILRTSLHLDGFSVPMQQVHREATLDMGVQDLRGLSRDAAITAIREWSTQERANKFDVGKPGLVRYFAHITDDGWWCSFTECHPILEGWSYHMLLMQLLTAYDEEKRGRTATLPEVPDNVRYVDFIAAEQKSLASPEDREYFRAIVEKNERFELPPTWQQAGEPERYRHDTSCRDIMDELKDVARRADVSLKAVIHAAYLKTMSMLTDAVGFYTGLVCDTRPEVLGADKVPGMYLNTLPFAHDRSAKTWRELLKRTFDQHVELWPHRRFPLAEVHRDAGATNRLIDTFFIYLDFHVVDGDMVETDTVLDDSPNEFALTVNFMRDTLLLHTNTSVLSRENGARLMAMYRGVLEAMIADLDGDAHAVFLSPEERRRVLEDWNRTDAPLSAEGVVERMRVTATLTPDTPAVADDHEQLTYGQLAGRASAVSAKLLHLPVGSVVPILDDPGAAFITAVLGVQGAGCAYIPLDTAAPVARTAKLLSDSGARTLLVGPAHFSHASEAVAGLDVDVIVLDGTEAPWSPLRGGERDLAYVIYTSGSTGTPKGAMVHRRGMVNHLLAKVEDLRLTDRDILVQNAPLTFDVSVWQMLAPLVSGGQVRVVSKETAQDPGALFGVAVDEGVTVLEVVPSLLRAALDDWDAGGQVPDLARLRWLVVTGEALPPDLCVRWFQRFPHVPLVNAYGPTECSDDVTHAVLRAADDFDAPLVPIGRAVRNTKLYVLDPLRQPTAIGIPGELYVAGVGVGLGYLNDPAKTEQAFVPDPFGGGIMYRTGDRVRHRADGQLEFLGRRDSQVKIRGQRVELGEVESALQALPGVTDAAAKIDAKRLVGYVVGEVDVAELRRLLITQLPEHLVPSALVVMPELPLTPNGKVDRKALPSPDRTALAGGAMVAPRNATEAALAEVWRQVLGLDEIGVDDDFFSVGGDSIRTLTLQSAMRAAGFPLSVRDVFACRTIAGLAQRLSEKDSGDDDRALVWFRKKATGPVLFCAHTQGGGAHWYLPMTEGMRDVSSVAAFEAPDSVGTSDVDLAALASQYVREMPTDRPFYLLGWSSGATLAWEMSLQLADHGTPATGLVLIDPTCDPSASSADVITTDVISERLAELLRAGKGLDDPEIVELLTSVNALEHAKDRDTVLLQVDRMRALTRAMYTYRYSRGSTPVRLVVTDDVVEESHGVLRNRSYQDYVARFTELSPRGLTLHRVSGDHYDILRPERGAELAALLAEFMGVDR
ncbi:pyoverdine synthetase D [Lentzea sp. NBRC 105346]|uniref:non-ribosomal peptide synthetase n=1 Tax=Lentzea sp. NBRC 105346 TaxID=3032205 RepID=UPI0024A5C894|nr:non-ribosomal peptide synthetase [Lentzea sp. NBRC 105346]GLZ29104.1 pyoverdine synthetase D [Lentzea sp. NBRC 105346]